jgi:hypothetical protein
MWLIWHFLNEAKIAHTIQDTFCVQKLAGHRRY